MSTAILERLNRVAVGEPLTSGSLTVIPLRGEEPSAIEWLIAEEAIARKGLDVGEVSESGTVDTLLVTNNCELPVFLLDGEVLWGGKQNRVMNTSVLVAAGATITVPVSCVERGRWSRGRSHSSSGFSVPSSMRSKMKSEVLDSLRTRRGHRSSQREVWASVDQVLSKSGSVSSTSDLSQAYADHQEEVNRAVEEVVLPEDSVGALFVIGGKFVCGDVFDSSSGFRKLKERILRGAALDAMHHREPDARVPGAEELLRWLKAKADAPPEEYKSPGSGREIRGESRGLQASALVHENGVVHLGLFAAD
jgi:hypothetical protein